MALSEFSRRSGELIAQALATLEGVKTPPDAWLAFAVQTRRETADGTSIGALSNNPLNLTTGGGRIIWPGQTGTYGGGDATEHHDDFAAFGTLEAGCWACAANYSYMYEEVIAAFTDLGDPVRIAEAIQRSPWDSGGYGGTLADEVRAEMEGDMDEAQIRAIVKDELAKAALTIAQNAAVIAKGTVLTVLENAIEAAQRE